ncbi:MAG: tRNA epoxyqueuosine(34) reductase QueG [Burkholderiaceae bacterium]|nr:MAG: tRNA epoxyqueuosine(34) reductase QueG [Burkholderiaceae bacterium]
MRDWANELGFADVGVSDIDLSAEEPAFQRWLDAGLNGTLDYMSRHGSKRTRPAELVPGTVSVITARMNYLPRDTQGDWMAQERARLARPGEGVISLYARGRDYHKVVRKRLQKLQTRIAERIGPFGHRVFSDSAPVLEKPLARKSGIGWQGKHGVILTREAGSMFFLGELFVDFKLPTTPEVDPRCGSCRACIDACPTGAIIAPGVVDARRCISYLTIEYHGSIDEELRPLMGNHVYGCDDCQTVCPWNKYAQRSDLPDFDQRDGLSGGRLTELFAWSEEEFLKRTEGGPIRRITHDMWLRNVAIALGNALHALAPDDPGRESIRAALQSRADYPSALVREHVAWALGR